MQSRPPKLLLAFLLLFGPLAADALACRIIEPIPRPIHPPPRPPEPKPILTRRHTADIRVKDQVAQVTVNATFYNPNPFRIEGTYWFPLPADAAVRDFEMVVNGKVMKGELLDAKRAKQIYEDIVRRQKDPALLEWIGSQMLKCRVFPMEGHKETKVALTYTVLLREDAGLVRLTYPLRSAKPNAGTIGQLVVTIAIESSLPLKTVYSATHPFEIRREGEKTAKLTYEANNVDPVRDVEVLFSRETGEVGLSLVSHKLAGEDGYFLLTITPALAPEDRKPAPKDILFVCDTSGSMAENEKIEQAKRALRFCLRSLNEGDRFNIITFSSDVRRFRDGLVARDADTVRKAEEYVDGLRALGGTAINEALLAALESAADAKNVPMIIFLTDGNPTIGVQDPKTILKNVSGANKARCRVFVFGVGYDVNTKLLDLLAEENRGAREYVKPKEDIEVKVSSFYTKVANPALSDLRLDFGGATVEHIRPRGLPDLFFGSQLVVVGRFKQPGEHTLTLSGKLGDRRKEFTYAVAFQDTRSDEYLPRVWALREVAFLLDQIRLHGESGELVNEVTRLGKRHGIITPYTSFLIVEDAPVPEPVRRELEAAAREGRRTFAAKSGGREAVEDSAGINRMAQAPAAGYGDQGAVGLHRAGEADEAADAEFEQRLRQAVRETVRHVAGKTFYVRNDGTWVDSTLGEDDDPIDMALWSEEFFELAREYSELGKALAETQKLIIRLGSRFYRFR